MRKIAFCSIILFLMSFNTFTYCQDTIEIIWQKTLGGSRWDAASDIIAAPDGGYIIVGCTHSNDGDVIGWHEGYDWNDYPYSDSWIVKLDKDGNIIWQKTYGGSHDDCVFAIIITLDGGYIVAGWTESNDGDVRKNHGGIEFWIMKLDKDGNIIWQKTYGGSAWEFASDIAVTPDGGYIVVGKTCSKDGDVSGRHETNVFRLNDDFWVVKLDKDGNIIWQKTLGGSDSESAYSVAVTQDGGYIVAGETHSNDGDVNENHGLVDSWIVRFDKDGNIVWQKTYGGSGWDDAFAIAITPDGGYIVVGSTSSNDGDVSKSHPSTGPWSDAWIAKLDKDGNII